MNEKKKNNLLQLVEKIDNRLKSIEKQIVDIKTSTNIMNNHVTFVETVWKRVKISFFVFDIERRKILCN